MKYSQKMHSLLCALTGKTYLIRIWINKNNFLISAGDGQDIDKLCDFGEDVSFEKTFANSLTIQFKSSANIWQPAQSPGVVVSLEVKGNKFFFPNYHIKMIENWRMTKYLQLRRMYWWVRWTVGLANVLMVSMLLVDMNLCSMGSCRFGECIDGLDSMVYL